MITLETRVHVPGLGGAELLDFLVNCTDERYRAWWPGTHLALHAVERHPGGIGDVVYMDEYVGSHRIRMHGIVRELEPGRRLVMQFKKGIVLPAWLMLEVDDDATGVTIRHTVQAGFGGIGRLLDPLLRLHFTRKLVRAMDEHVRTEFPLLRDLLHREWNARAAGGH